MPDKDLFFTCSLVCIRHNIDIFKKWQFIFRKAKSDLDGGCTNENWDFLFFFHSYITKVLDAPKMNCSFQKSFFARLAQFIEIGNMLANDRSIF